uniref:Uncharacterized protein n=1 Tax=viral metagenome TaxID=1070528 RepID=A0A6C0KD04_9ZZZZ|tara:strand:- start:364 stop:594 length:231 start_codon:yes stop_codon:yes gene_type:complete
MTFEKALIRKNYTLLSSTDSILSYCSPEDKTSQINLTKENDLYKFSFPLGDIHYATFFKDKNKLKDYMNFILVSKL